MFLVVIEKVITVSITTRIKIAQMEKNFDIASEKSIFCNKDFIQ
jgi:hypothetical protein